MNTYPCIRSYCGHLDDSHGTRICLGMHLIPTEDGGAEWVNCYCKGMLRRI